MRNLIAHGEGILQFGSEEHSLHSIQVTTYDESKYAFPGLIRWVLGFITLDYCLVAKYSTSIE